MKNFKLFLSICIVFSSLACDLFMNEDEPEVNWSSVDTPNDRGRRLTILNDWLILKTDTVLFKSSDLGKTWHRMNQPAGTKYFVSIDVDEQTLHITTAHQVFYSTDFGETYISTLDPIPDTPRGLNFENNVGWMSVSRWGLYSGPNKKLPGSDWEHVADGVPYHYQGVISRLYPDPRDPANKVFISGNRGDDGSRSFKTFDGGATWTELNSKLFIYHAVLVGNTFYLFSYNKYSTNNGGSWHSMDLDGGIHFYKDPYSDLIFAGQRYDEGVYMGRLSDLGKFYSLGPEEEEHDFIAFIVIDNILFALSEYGNLFKADISGIR